MIRKIRWTLGLCLVGVISYGQAVSVRVSTHKEDQIVQGPCYTFALMAALESNALENEPLLDAGNMNFNEWRFYSECVVPKDEAWAGKPQIENSISHAHQYGATNGSHPIPTQFDCPTPNDPNDPNPPSPLRPACFAIFDCGENTTWCRTSKMYAPSVGGLGGNGTNCEDLDGDAFGFTAGSPHTFQLQGTPGQLFVKNINANATYIKAQLAAGKGVIALFDDYRNTGIQHAVFIYGHTGDKFFYKDSWPGDPENFKESELPPNLVRTYVITGTMQGPPGTACNYAIQGPSSVAASGETTYTLDGGTGSTSNIVWQYPASVTLVSGQGTRTLKVRSDNCSNQGNGVISVSYTNGGLSCSNAKTVSILGGPTAKPTGIEVWGFNWSMNGSLGLTCPNTTLELRPIDTNPGHPVTQYQWSITGASILQQSGESALIRTSSASSSNQVYAVRANKNNCGWSAWRHLSATSGGSHCGGGLGGPGGGFGFLRSAEAGSDGLDFSDYFSHSLTSEKVDVEVISLTGQQLYLGQGTRQDPVVGLQRLPEGWVFIRLYDPIEGRHTTLRHQIVH